MQNHFTRLAIAGLFVAAGCNFAIAQGKSSRIDVSHMSAIRYNTDIVTPQQMQQMDETYHQQLLAENPKYDEQRNAFEENLQRILTSGKVQPNTQSVITIPTVVHIVYNTTAQNITDNQVLSQILVVNQDYGRTNPDANQTPSAFAAVAANTGIQFCLAQRDPNGNPTTGIERRQTTVTSFSTNNAVKHYSQGGLDIWDPTRYMNIWVCNLGSGLLGYGEFPTGSPTTTFGVVILYSAFGSNFTSYGTFSDIGSPYDRGRTTTHEFSHCFNLYHIWGDDGTACTGTDYCADTPNQAGATTTCYNFPHTDACTPSGNGIMFMNYMDYSYDNCLNLFTQNQSTRMNAVLNSAPYNALATSNGCQPVNLSNNDAGVLSITTPNGTICTATFTPVVVLKNYGANALTSCLIKYKIDNNALTTYSWSGNLASNATTSVTLNSMTTTNGAHTFTALTSNPNANTDSQPSNDQTTSNFTASITGTALPYSYGFEPTTWPPAGWTTSNPDGGITWVRTTAAAKTGAASAYMDNFTYQTGVGQKDDMILLPLNLTTQTNPVLTFQVAYTYYQQTNPAQNFTDSLRVLISNNCGQTWTSMYYKGGVNLSTATPVPNTNNAFVPTASQWRMETISLAPYASYTNAMIMFRSLSQYGDELYIDDINIQASTGINSLDLNSEISLFPNPSNGMVYVNTSLPSAENIEIRIFDMLGRTMGYLKQNDVTSNTFSFDLSDKMNGVYFVEIKANGESITKKLVLNR